MDSNFARMPERLRGFRERLLSDLILLAQTRAPSGQEEQRTRYVLDRFTQVGVPEVRQDEAGNAVGIIPGKTGEKRIMLVSNLDSAVKDKTDVNVSVREDRVVGAGCSGTPLSLSAMCMLPEILEDLGIRLNADLMLVGSVNALGAGSSHGLRHLLDNEKRKPDYGVVLEGLPLGKCNCFSIGSLRGDIIVDTPNDIQTEVGHTPETALVVITRIINRMLRIPVPRRPYTDIRLGRLRAGITHDVEPLHAELGFEILSYEEDALAKIRQAVEDAAEEMGSRYAAEVKVNFFRSRRAGGLEWSHPLVKCVRKIHKTLGIETVQKHNASELAHFIHHEVPAVTLGLSNGKRKINTDDYAMIDPCLEGLAQVIGLLQNIDAGVCDDA